MQSVHEVQADALRQYARAHDEIASHHSAESRDALALAALYQRHPNALEHYALLAKSSGECARRHRAIAQCAALAADRLLGFRGSLTHPPQPTQTGQ